MTLFRLVLLTVAVFSALVQLDKLAWGQGVPPPSNPPPILDKSNSARPDANLADKIHQCDLAAAHPYDRHRPQGVPGVDFKMIDGTKAQSICYEALIESLDNDYHGNDRGRLTYELARCYDKNGDVKNTEPQYSAAIDGNDYHYRTAAARLSEFYLSGTGGVEKDIPKAVQLVETAANDGFAPAEETLGRWYQNGVNGLQLDQTRAAQWFKLAADQGYPTPAASDDRPITQRLFVNRLFAGMQKASVRCDVTDKKFECEVGWIGPWGEGDILSPISSLFSSFRFCGRCGYSDINFDPGNPQKEILPFVGGEALTMDESVSATDSDGTSIWCNAEFRRRSDGQSALTGAVICTKN